ncbi:MAG TPA: DUF302 domain-containing protein [Polyangiaceae bacterium]|nr:DUF302 domain-containing protein [Polyangiaceae bacterium]
MTDRAPLARTLHLPFAQVLERVPVALKTEGFGVLTTIDVKATVKARLDKDIAPYTILGACNPTMAHQAITLDPTIGVHLPCNVVVRELPDGGVEVRSIDPLQTIASSGRQELAGIADQVRAMLARVIAAV